MRSRLFTTTVLTVGAVPGNKPVDKSAQPRQVGKRSRRDVLHDANDIAKAKPAGRERHAHLVEDHAGLLDQIAVHHHGLAGGIKAHGGAAGQPDVFARGQCQAKT